MDVAAVSVRPGGRTQSSVIVCSGREAARAICTSPAEALDPASAAVEAVLAADWVHVDHLGWPAVAALLARLPRQRRPKLSVDAGNAPVTDPRCDPAEADLYVPTAEALVERYGGDVRTALAACPARTAVATAGAGGAYHRGPDGTVHHEPGVRVEGLRSTLGAGDVFHGALLAAVVRGLPPAAALRRANAVAALSCRGVDGREASTPAPSPSRRSRWQPSCSGTGAGPGPTSCAACCAGTSRGGTRSARSADSRRHARAAPPSGTARA